MLYFIRKINYATLLHLVEGGVNQPLIYNFIKSLWESNYKFLEAVTAAQPQHQIASAMRK